MSDFKNSTSKFRNPLLNVSVTGVTFEEFTQNAMLCPAPEISSAPSVTSTSLVSDTSDTPEIKSQSIFTTVLDSQLPVSNTNTPTQSIPVDNSPAVKLFGSPNQASNVSSSLTSVFSSFTNILNFNGQEKDSSQHLETVPVFNGDDMLKNVDFGHPSFPTNQVSSPFLFNTSLPLQPPQQPPLQQSIRPPLQPPPTGVTNNFRRQSQKKITYAPIPGLSSSTFNPNILSPQTNTQNLSPVPQQGQSFSADVSLSKIDLQPNTTLNNITGSFVNVPFYTSPQINLENFSRSLTTSILEPEPIKNLDCSSFFTSNMNTAPANEMTPIKPATLDSVPGHAFYTNSTSPQMVPDIASSSTSTSMYQSPYRPVYYHWFFKREIEEKDLWEPFSMVDSLALEQSFTSADLSPEDAVATDGGRFDVNILRRQRIPVYWTGTSTEVRRCSWFYKGINNANGHFTPYEENIATELEEEYKIAYESNQWHRRVELPNGEAIVFHAPDVLVLLPSTTTTPDVWTNTTPTTARPRIVKRGMDEFNIDEGEPTNIDHILFLVHGIGSACDLKFRSVEEVVDDFRSIALQLVQSHYRSSCDRGIVNRIEVLPVSWHNQLHSEDTGIDRKLKNITLESIPKLRDFTNDTLLDILFYTSPIYCQTIISTVGNELNRIYDLFKQRNPSFTGGVSLGGHSLGSLILFDLLGHQHHVEKEEDIVGGNDDVVPPMKSLNKPHPANRRMSRRISYMMGAVGTGQPQLMYPHLNFHPTAFFAFGSPIGMFVTVRGLDSLGEQFVLPTCPRFFNIFHPYDPVAYRIESLVNPELTNVRPVLIPHHKGRKRMHLELKETVARVGADLKQRIVDSMRNTWNSVYQLALFHRSDKSLEEEVDKVLEEQLEKEKICVSRTESMCEEDMDFNISCGILNSGRRIDYVLQEAPLEFFNEYIFALTSHVCYWESEDTMLLMLKEIYNSMGISTDSKIPQQTMTIERSVPAVLQNMEERGVYVEPLKPIVENPSLGPPPVSGFIRKT